MEAVTVISLVVAVLAVAVALRRPRAALAPAAADMRGELDRLRESMLTSQGELRAQLASVGATAGALREVLASPKARGQWGERTADDLLRTAGLVEGVSYVRQRATRGGTIPDVTFLLPGERVLHMDVKFPIDNYTRWLGAESEEARAACLDAFRRDVRARVRELTGRGYVDTANGTLDYVLAFLPNESIYAFVHEHDPDLLDEALRRKVVLCSPLTLYAVLAVVRHAADAAALERTSGEVLQVLNTFTAEWDHFTESLDKLGRAVDSIERAYGELAGTRRRALERPLARIDELRRGAPLPAPEEPLRLAQ